MAVRGSVEDYHEPKVFFSEKAERFVKQVLKLEPRELALKLEAWAVSGIGNKVTPCHIRFLLISFRS